MAGTAAVRSGVRLTHPGRVLYPLHGVTKQDLAEYLARMAPRLLPHVVNRPMSLVRCPQGRSGKCFFQRHVTRGLPEAFHAVRIPGKDKEPYLYVDSVEGIVSSAQIGALELHLWGARIEAIECPDRMVFDLDPDPAVPFSEVRHTAERLREILESAALHSFPMLTGGKGLHVVVPLAGAHGWDDVKRFSRGIAAALAADEPHRYTIKAAKNRRTNRIFIDWMRNLRGGTAIAPYSTRAREGCPVATPVTWRELSRIDRADKYTIHTLPRRLRSLRSDPWEDYFHTDQDIPSDALDLFP